LAAITRPWSFGRSTRSGEASIDLVRRAEESLGVRFQDSKLLEQAFVHRSYLNENPGFPLGSNERLEYLGDAVVELAVSDHLFCLYPDASEGDLTAMRAQLVRIETLGRLARDLGLGDLLYLSKGAAEAGTRMRLRILGQTFEAVVGALYLDQGFPAADRFIIDRLSDEVAGLSHRASHRDAKSRLQQAAQAATGAAPDYVVDSAIGPGHQPRFVVTVRLGETVLATGTGDSKREAEQQAAAIALDLWPSQVNP
jgi:ribonuclease-3